MFERFTERARTVIILAQDESRTLEHYFIGTEHLLIALIREEEGLAARVLRSLDITEEKVRKHVTQGRPHNDGSGQPDVPTVVQIPFSPRAKRVLEKSLRSSRSLGHSHIDTEHILLALVDEHEGKAARILLQLGVDAEKVREETLRRVP